MRNVNQYPHLPTDDDYLQAFSELLREANGFVYQGERADGIAAALRVLRAKPDLAEKLLDTMEPPV